MAKEKVKKKEEKLTDLSNLNNLEMSDGYICDVETGICGPADELEDEKVKEKKNENNHLV